MDAWAARLATVLAQALSGIEIDDSIPIELYEAVAIVIGYVLRTSNKP